MIRRLSPCYDCAMRFALIIVLALASSAVFAALLGCADEMEAISQVSKFRVLGIQADPPELAPGESTQMRALFADPQELGVTVMWFPMEGLITPSSMTSSQMDLVWFPAVTQVTNGIASYGSNIAVPPDYLDDLRKDKCSDDGVEADENWREDPACKRTVTMLVLACAGGEIDPQITSAIGMLQTALAQFLVEDITQQELETIITDTFVVLQETLGSFEEMSDIETLCQGENVETIISTKTFGVSLSDHKNAVPQIDSLSLKIGDTWTVTPPWTEPGEPPVFTCDGENGCRDGAEIQAFLTPDSFQTYTKKEFEAWKTVDERTYISWFTDGGNFDADRSGNNGEADDPFEVTWIPPMEGGVFTLWAVSHDIRGGVDWKRYTISALVP